MRIVVLIGVSVLVGLAAISGAMVLMEDRFIYFPAADLSATPRSVGLWFQDRWLTTDDGVRLHAWHIPNPEARYTAIDFHGNAGTTSAIAWTTTRNGIEPGLPCTPWTTAVTDAARAPLRKTGCTATPGPRGRT